MATPNFMIYEEQLRQKEQYMRELLDYQRKYPNGSLFGVGGGGAGPPANQGYPGGGGVSLGDPFGLGGGHPGFSPLGNYTPTTSPETTKKRKVLLCMC